MTLSLHTIKPAAGSRKKSFRIGRGNASGRGTTAGRGTKGQRARTGGRNRLKIKGMKQMILGFPKLRGFRSRFAKAETLPLARLAAACVAGEKIDLRALKTKKLVARTAESVKIVGSIDVGKSLVVSGVGVSASAKAAIERAGGSVAS